MVDACIHSLPSERNAGPYHSQGLACLLPKGFHESFTQGCPLWIPVAPSLCLPKGSCCFLLDIPFICASAQLSPDRELSENRDVSDWCPQSIWHSFWHTQQALRNVWEPGNGIDMRARKTCKRSFQHLSKFLHIVAAEFPQLKLIWKQEFREQITFMWIQTYS